MTEPAPHDFLDRDGLLVRGGAQPARHRPAALACREPEVGDDAKQLVEMMVAVTSALEMALTGVPAFSAT